MELHARGHDIAAVYTRAAKPAGRGMALQETPVAREAARLGLPVLTPVTLKDKGAQDVFASHQAEAAVVVAYGLILPKAVLDAVPLGCFNIHASLLPRWRGAAPINRAIMAGDAASGISIMKMDEGLDTGAVVNADRIPIRANMTAGEIHDELARLGAELMARSLEALARGTLTETPQPEDGVTYAAKLSNEETRIDWARPAQVVHDHIRGLSPFPGAWCECEGARLKVLRSTRADGNGEPGTALDDKLTIACRAGAVRLTQLQRAGKQPMAAEDFLRGNPVKAGASLA
ncbi:MAG: methionyl-tRNA formyltransferase [Pseudolabrys sp.]|nr:methionyl-tRNA formyltransferase [Pseudolabrys sp.]